MNYKNTTVKVCTSCNGKTGKICAKKFQSTFVDCGICQKAVIYNSSILCLGCSHWVHKKCTNLTNDEIQEIEKTIDTWFCTSCTAEIFSFSQLNTIELNKVLNPRVSTNGKPVTTSRPKPTSKNQCFSCNGYVPRNHYKNKNIMYNDRKVRLCMACSIDQPNLKDKHLIEFLDCSICKKYVDYESALCNSCHHWVHTECAKLSHRDLATISGDDYGDWFCLPCTSSTFPLYPTYDHDNNSIDKK